VGRGEGLGFGRLNQEGIYEPRPQFQAFHERDKRWSILVCHRRAGKTVACINELILRALITEGGRFGYIAPFYSQAKTVAWDYLKRYAAPYLASAPNESELRVDFRNGARIRLFGADNADSLRGVYFHGVVLDEYGQFRPSVWGEIIRPTLSDKQGWAVFIGTPKGRVGLYDIWAGKDSWKDVDLYRLMLKASETGIMDEAELVDARRTMTEDQYEQEYECSFEAAIIGAVYGKLLAIAEADKRVCSVPYDPSVPVYTAWDLGIGDPTAIIFAQQVGKELHIIDYYESSGVDVAHYAAVLKQKPYNYGGHILPHDASPKELTSGKSLSEVLYNLGIRPQHIQPVSHVEDGINAARLKIPMVWFDERKCERLVDALKLYRYEWDEKLGTLRSKPVHDWTSHAADAFRYLCEGLGRGVGNNSFYKPLKYGNSGIY
jgi:phage terminase large subunit